VRIRDLVGLALAFLTSAWCVAFVVFAIVVVARGWNISKCPSCQSNRIRSSCPTSVDKLLYRTNVMPYRCEACQKRFYAIKRKRVVPVH